MDPNLLNLRTALFDMRSMVGNGSTDNERARRALNRALDKMSEDIPTAFVPDEEHVVVYPDVVSGDTTAYLQPTAEPRVLEFKGAGGAALTPSSPWTPNTTGVWDGIMHLEITDDAGEKYRRQSREWWVEVDTNVTPNTYNYYVSLDRPISRSTGSGWTFRIHQPEFFLRADVKKIFEPIKIYDDTRRAIGSIGWRDARSWAFEDYRGEYNSRPEMIWRTRFFEMPVPTEAPIAEASGAVWAGPYQEGEFSFVYTYCWGKRDAEWQSSMTGVRDPMWESAPSPPASYSHSTGTSGVAIKITPALIDPEFGWYNTGGLRHGRGGFYVRVYAKRTAVRTGGLGDAALDRVETSNRYYLIDQFDPLDPGGPLFYTWNGQRPLDHSRPLHHSTGYYGYSPYPHQDAEYEFDIRCSRSVKALIDDYDTVPMREGDAVEALLQLACYYFALQDGVDESSAQRRLETYKRFVNEARGQLNPVATIRPRGYRASRPRRRWSFTDA